MADRKRSIKKLIQKAQSPWLWIGAVIIGALIILLIFGIFKGQPREEGKPETAGLLNLPKMGQLKEYKLNFDRDFEPDFGLNLSPFEEDNDWRGNALYDTENFFEGESSLYLVSKNHSLGQAFLESKINLNDYNFFDVLIFVDEPKNVEFLRVKFGNLALTNYYEYVFGSLSEGWNFVRMPREQFGARTTSGPPFNWSQIEKIEFSLISRPGTEVTTNFDSLRAEKNIEYQKQWEMARKNADFVGIGQTADEKAALLARSFGTSVATLKEIGDAEDFVFRASVSPQRTGRSGIFFRGNPDSAFGYYFLLSGLDGNTWQLLKQNDKTTSVLKEGTIKNVAFQSDEKYWLQISIKGENFEAELSRDGENFAKVAEFTDKEFTFGQVGIAAMDQTFSFFDDFYYKKQ